MSNKTCKGNRRDTKVNNAEPQIIGIPRIDTGKYPYDCHRYAYHTNSFPAFTNVWRVFERPKIVMHSRASSEPRQRGSRQPKTLRKIRVYDPPQQANDSL